MIVPSDQGYQETKKIKQGIKKLDYPFSELCTWINKLYKVNSINAYLDHIEDVSRLRLNIVLESSEDKNKFHSDFNYDIRKQNILARRFHELSSETNGLPLVDNHRDIFVCFHAFEPIAIDEANMRIPDEDINKILTVSSDIWTIRKDFRTVFYYSDDQIVSNSKNGLNRKIEALYINALSIHDEFGYCSIDNFRLRFDSKANFENTYNGNWFYYSRDH